MDELKLKLEQLALTHAKALAKDLVEQVVFQALEEVVKNSQNKVDDALLAAFEGTLKTALQAAVEKIGA